MRKLWNRMVKRTVTRVLTLMGIGASSMLFMACYGTPPANYEFIDDGDTMTVVQEDSTAMTTAAPEEENDETR